MKRKSFITINGKKYKLDYNLTSDNAFWVGHYYVWFPQKGTYDEGFSCWNDKKPRKCLVDRSYDIQRGYDAAALFEGEKPCAYSSDGAWETRYSEYAEVVGYEG